MDSYRYAIVCVIIILVCLSLSYHTVHRLQNGIFSEEKHKAGEKQNSTLSFNASKSSSLANVTEIVSLTFAVGNFAAIDVSGLELRPHKNDLVVETEPGIK